MAENIYKACRLVTRNVGYHDSNGKYSGLDFHLEKAIISNTFHTHGVLKFVEKFEHVKDVKELHLKDI